MLVSTPTHLYLGSLDIRTYSSSHVGIVHLPAVNFKGVGEFYWVCTVRAIQNLVYIALGNYYYYYMYSFYCIVYPRSVCVAHIPCI